MDASSQRTPPQRQLHISCGEKATWEAPSSCSTCPRAANNVAKNDWNVAPTTMKSRRRRKGSAKTASNAFPQHDAASSRWSLTVAIIHCLCLMTRVSCQTTTTGAPSMTPSTTTTATSPPPVVSAQTIAPTTGSPTAAPLPISSPQPTLMPTAAVPTASVAPTREPIPQQDLIYPLQLTLTGVKLDDLDEVAQGVWTQATSDQVREYHQLEGTLVEDFVVKTRLMVNETGAVLEEDAQSQGLTLQPSPDGNGTEAATHDTTFLYSQLVKYTTTDLTVTPFHLLSDPFAEPQNKRFYMSRLKNLSFNKTDAFDNVTAVSNVVLLSSQFLATENSAIDHLQMELFPMEPMNTQSKLVWQQVMSDFITEFWLDQFFTNGTSIVEMETVTSSVTSQRPPFTPPPPTPPPTTSPTLQSTPSPSPIQANATEAPPPIGVDSEEEEASSTSTIATTSATVPPAGSRHLLKKGRNLSIRGLQDGSAESNVETNAPTATVAPIAPIAPSPMEPTLNPAAVEPTQPPDSQKPLIILYSQTFEYVTLEKGSISAFDVASKPFSSPDSRLQFVVRLRNSNDPAFSRVNNVGVELAPTLAPTVIPTTMSPSFMPSSGPSNSPRPSTSPTDTPRIPPTEEEVIDAIPDPVKIIVPVVLVSAAVIVGLFAFRLYWTRKRRDSTIDESNFGNGGAASDMPDEKSMSENEGGVGGSFRRVKRKLTASARGQPQAGVSCRTENAGDGPSEKPNLESPRPPLNGDAVATCDSASADGTGAVQQIQDDAGGFMTVSPIDDTVLMTVTPIDDYYVAPNTAT